MILTGIGDEAGAPLTAQIAAAQRLRWRALELRMAEIPGFQKANVHDLPDPAFNILVDELENAGIAVCAFGSAIGNWAKKLSDPFETTLAEVKRCIPRMQRLNCRFVRIMSYKPGDDEDRTPPEAFARVREITARFHDAGLQAVHENCMNYGGMSWRHGLELLEKCPGLKWVYDTANPRLNADRSQPKPWPRQDPWEYWEHIRDHVAHIHVKDATFVPAKNDCDYNYPGEGEARVRDILRDSLARGYDGAISIEPHLASVFHDPTAKAAETSALESFVDYGQRMERMIAEIQAELPTRRG